MVTPEEGVDLLLNHRISGKNQFWPRPKMCYLDNFFFLIMNLKFNSVYILSCVLVTEISNLFGIFDWNSKSQYQFWNLRSIAQACIQYDFKWVWNRHNPV